MRNVLVTGEAGSGKLWNPGTGDSRLINRIVLDLTGGSVEYIPKRPRDAPQWDPESIIKATKT
jgi:hypothetical protein